MRASSNLLPAAAAAAALLLPPCVAAQNSDPCAQAASQIQVSMARQNSASSPSCRRRARSADFCSSQRTRWMPLWPSPV